MGSIFRFISVGALGFFVLLPFWGGNAADSLVANSRSDALLSRAGISADFGDNVVRRLQEMRNEIHRQQCARGPQSYCMLGRCWITTVPTYCAEDRCSIETDRALPVWEQCVDTMRPKSPLGGPLFSFR